MTLPSAARVRRVDPAGTDQSSAFRAVRGWLPLTAVLVAVTATALGALIDRFTTSTIGDGTRWGFVLGVLVAALMVRRVSLFTAAVQPPLVFICAVLVVFAVNSSQRTAIVLIQITGAFLTLAVGTALVLVVTLIRLMIQRAPRVHR